jgi:Ca2+-binding RTX toxin-like protein
MLTYRHVATYLGDKVPFAIGIADMQAFQSSAGNTLYTVTQTGGGIAAYRLDAADQALQLTGTQAYAPGMGYLDRPAAALVQMGGSAALFGVGLVNGTTAGLSLGADGAMVGGAALGPLGQDVTQLGSFQTPMGTFLYSARNNLPAFTIWQVNGDGSLGKTAIGNLPWLPGQQGTEINDMQVVQLGDRSFMLTASALGNYVAIQGINGDGTLGRTQVLWSDSGIGLAAPNHIGTVTVQGVTYLIVAGAQSSSLTTMRITYEGTLVPVDHVIDSLNTRFSGATALETAMVDGRAYVFAGGGDDGISVFTVMPNGRLLFLTTLVDADDRSLADVSAIQAMVIGGKIALFVTSATEAGLTHLVFDPGQIGETRTVGAGAVTGTAGDDLLRAGEGTTRIRGGDGDDILISGSEPVELAGGNGADIFVPTAVSGQIVIRDFELGVDRLDLSNLGMLRSITQLTFRGQWDGIRIVFGDTVIVIRTRDGSTLQASDFNDSMFPAAHYQPPAAPSNLIGTDGDDTLTAVAGNAYLYGLGGADLLMAAEGRDTLIGGAGDDTLMGGAGNDRLIGEEGDDRLIGGDGDDELQGGTGNDTLYGGAGNDSLYGYAGNDLIYGEDGDDHIEDWTGAAAIWAGAGNDEVVTGGGNDRIAGEAGQDTISAGGGNDSIWGGAGNDLLQGGFGNDYIDGGLDHDMIQGGPGNDTIHGGYGFDTIWAGDGNDRISGGFGRDQIWGGAGSDMIWGGAHDDVLRGEAGNDSIAGGDGNDTISGGLHNDLLYGNAGNDWIYGDDGNDLIYGGYGNDRLAGNAGNDRIFGGPGADWIQGGDGIDILRGDGGNDSITGGAGNDTIHGGSENDVLYGDAGDDRLDGGTGNDTLNGGPGNDLLIDMFGHGRLIGGAGRDTLLAGAGNDTLDGGMGSDSMRGGAGADVFVFTARAAFDGSTDVIADFGAGADRMDFRGLGLSFVGDAGFSGAGQIRSYAGPVNSWVEIDLNGDGQADLTIMLQNRGALGADDLLL